MQVGESGGDEDTPMSDINTTPLVDVMLVLLIMFIITIPVQTHAVKLDLPTPTNDPLPPILPEKNVIVITPQNTVLWNGVEVDMIRLRQYLDRTTLMRPMPELHLQPDAEARYEVVDEVLAVTKLAHITAMGFVGNEFYQSW